MKCRRQPALRVVAAATAKFRPVPNPNSPIRSVPSPAGSLSRFALDLGGGHEHALRLFSAVGGVVDVVEVSGEGLPLLPSNIRRFNHGATGRSGSLIHSLQEPG